MFAGEASSTTSSGTIQQNNNNTNRNNTNNSGDSSLSSSNSLHSSFEGMNGTHKVSFNTSSSTSNSPSSLSPPSSPTITTSPSSSSSSSNSIFSDGDLLYEETKKGAKESASIAEFIRKRVKIEDEYARALLQLCKSFPSGSSGSAISEVFSNLIECTAKQAGSHLAAASQLGTEVINPLKVFVDDLKIELKGVQQEAQKLAAEKKDVLDAFKRSKSSFESACKEANSDDGEKIDELEDEYKVHIKHTNTYLQTVYSDKLQKIAMDLQKTETLRMHKMKVSLKKFVNVLEELPQQSANDFLCLSDKINSLDTKEEIKNFSALVRTVSKEDEILFEAYERGPPKAKKEWRITMAMRTPSNQAISERVPKLDEKKIIRAPPTAVFGVPLEIVMERQKTKHPSLKIPFVIVTLIDLIKHLNGLKTEGIFRIPGVARETESLKKVLDEGEEAEGKMFPNVHTAASTLKLWLRELPNSIIPEDMYYSCLACESDEEAFICFDAFPPLNRRIVVVFLQFFKELLQEENVSKTKMDVENISIVFTPSFMRCSSVPATSLLDNVDKERTFVYRLISSSEYLLSKYMEVRASNIQQKPVARDTTNWKSVRPNNNNNNSNNNNNNNQPNSSPRPQLLSSPLTRIASQKFLN